MINKKAFIFILAAVIAAGFAWNLAILKDIRQTLNSLAAELQSFRSLVIALDSTEPALPASDSAAKKETAVPTEEKTTTEKTTDIPTSIIFSTISSPLLLPQSNLTVTVEKASLSKTNQTVSLNLKIFTSESDAFNAIEPTPLFAIFEKNSGELKQPIGLNGPFNQLPPRSAVSGQIIFQANSDQNAFIFKIGENDQVKFYEFDFNKKTYRETTVG